MSFPVLYSSKIRIVETSQEGFRAQSGEMSLT